MRHFAAAEAIVRALRATLLAMGLLAACGAACADTDSVNRQWFTLTIGGERVGYAYDEQRARSGARVDARVMRVEVTQLRRRSRIETRLEVTRDTAGAPVEVRFQSSAGVARSGWRALFDAGAKGAAGAPGASTGSASTIEILVDGRAGGKRLGAPADLVLPDRLPLALAPLWRDGQTQTQIRYLDPSTASLVSLLAERTGQPDPARTDAAQTDAARTDATATDAAPIGTAPADAAHNEASHTGTPSIHLTTGAGDRGRLEMLWIDARGQLVRRQERFFGTTLVWEPCARDCDAAVAQPFDPMARLVVRSPYRVPKSALAGPIRYILSRRDGAIPHLPATGEQAVVTDGARAIVTICRECGTAEEVTAAERQRYTSPNPWVQSDASEIRSFAKRHSHAGSAEQIMTELVNAVREHMTGPVDYLGYASARDALRTRSGDCTEFAVLLAAAARARGIPARLVFGLVYSDRFSGKKDVFSPHAWVQAWTGTRWVSFDAGLGQFDATHLALAIGDGEPRGMDALSQPARDWRIEKLGRVRIE